MAPPRWMWRSPPLGMARRKAMSEGSSRRAASKARAAAASSANAAAGARSAVRAVSRRAREQRVRLISARWPGGGRDPAVGVLAVGCWDQFLYLFAAGAGPWSLDRLQFG